MNTPKTKQVSPEEKLTRYLFSKNHYSPQNNRVKYGAFLPNSNGKTSVFRISKLSEKKIWNIGETQVASSIGKSIKGRGDILARYVFLSKLEILPDNNPPRHANIVGWPDEKAEQKIIALELAENANLYLR